MLDSQKPRIWPITLPQIETTVSAYLGPAECRETSKANLAVNRAFSRHGRDAQKRFLRGTSPAI